MAKRSDGGSEPDIPGFRDLSVIGRGASSTVYRGHDDELNRWVAVKVFAGDDPDDPARKRFRREREITANLGKHPHVVQVLGTGFTKNGLPYVVMELYEQGSISDRIRTVGAFSVAETIDIGIKIADAVGAAHRAGVLHRDIKPQNVLLSEYGPALADFGIARSATNLEWSQSLEQLTPMHAAPEILMGEPPSPEADVYSLGSTLYTMLAGRPPFAGPPGESLLRYQIRVAGEPVPPVARNDVPDGVVAVLTKALAKEPADRYRTPIELRDALLALQRGAGPTAERPASVWAPSPAVEPVDSDEMPTMARGAAASPIGTPTDDEATPDSVWAPASQAPVRHPVPSEPLESSVSPAWSLEEGPLSAVPMVADASETVFRDRPSPPVHRNAPDDGDDAKRRKTPIVIAVGVGLLIVIILAVVLLGGLLGKPKQVRVTSTIPITSAGRPVDVRVTVAGDGSTANLQWTPGNGDESYVVLQVPEAGSTSIVRTPDPTSPHAAVTDLDPTAPYCFIVIANVGSNAEEAPSCTCIRNGALAPQKQFPHLTCSAS